MEGAEPLRASTVTSFLSPFGASFPAPEAPGAEVAAGFLTPIASGAAGAGAGAGAGATGFAGAAGAGAGAAGFAGAAGAGAGAAGFAPMPGSFIAGAGVGAEPAGRWGRWIRTVRLSPSPEAASGAGAAPVTEGVWAAAGGTIVDLRVLVSSPAGAAGAAGAGVAPEIEGGGVAVGRRTVDLRVPVPVN